MSKEAQLKSAERIVQYILVRSDLFTKLKWPMGAVMAQACHASNAVMHMYRDDLYVKEYFDDLDNMTTVILGAEGESDLLELKGRLEGVIDHKLWVEQPEGISTALATKPYPKKMVAQYFTPYKTLK